MFFKNKIITSLAAAMMLTGVGVTATQVFVPQQQIQEVKADSWINNYIDQHDIQPVQIQYQEGTFSHWFGYENGVGKPEGVVVHETADPGVSAARFVQSFNNNWQTAETYVHAFVDDQQIINIHNTDYGVWGAGPTANARYIQVELCEVSTADQFAHSVANDAFYIATMLHKYNLPLKYGTTVVTHDQVSRWFGETDHTDPTGYFAKWNYGMDQFIPLIQKYYDQISNGSATTNAATNNGGVDASSQEGTVKANNPNSYAVPLASFNSKGGISRSNRGLANDTVWYTDQSRSYDGHTYYRVSTNEWIIDTYASFTAK